MKKTVSVLDSNKDFASINKDGSSLIDNNFEKE